MWNGFKNLVQVGAESTDACPPVKTVFSGIRAILKLCEVSWSVTIDTYLNTDL